MLSLQLGCDVGGRLARHIPPVLVPPDPALRPDDGRCPVTADVGPREHLTREHLMRRLCDLLSRSGAGGGPDDLAPAPAGLYLIAEADAQFTGKPLLGHQLGQVIRRNADAPVVAADALRPDGRYPVMAEVEPREHLTRHLRDLLSRSGAGAYQMTWPVSRLAFP